MNLVLQSNQIKVAYLSASINLRYVIFLSFSACPVISHIVREHASDNHLELSVYSSIPISAEFTIKYFHLAHTSNKSPPITGI